MLTVFDHNNLCNLGIFDNKALSPRKELVRSLLRVCHDAATGTGSEGHGGVVEVEMTQKPT